MIPFARSPANEVRLKKIMLNFSAWMYRIESQSVSFFMYLCDLLYKCNLIRIE